MSALLSQIIDKYQSVAPQRVIQAIEKASARTGANFSFMMDKASAESSFNPSATSKSSTATGLFQFIESTWLNMVKQHGAKHGMGKFANQIQIRNGRPCVDNCNVKDTILNLRKNPEI
ncbi:MAG: lytic transglycosylase domain-containing protein, partial [Alphaproteobacteria bacterium]|nr:lytic transglycosylase domain-containing protein [Alphaproteobacteria bacterium]